MTTSKTTGLPNHAEYAGEKLFLPSAITFVSLLDFGITFTGCKTTFSASAVGNLFKSEQIPLNVAAAGLAIRTPSAAVWRKTKPTQVLAESKRGSKVALNLDGRHEVDKRCVTWRL
jgi:hypothetical protein